MGSFHMPLLEIWRTNPDGIKAYAIRQIVAFAGDGRLRDQSECATELRAYLRETSSDKLAEYAAECLQESFEDSGFALQDVINEIGRRLEFQVENGRYRGRSGEVGFDGIWRASADQAIIVEVKTTDAYNVRLEEVAGYQAALIREGRVSSDASTLFVVGRKGTGALEAQIRGSRHAWDMRVVGVDSLIKLMRVKVKSTEDATVRQIRELLRPFEYTRIDRIVDVVFDTATDIEQSAEPEVESVAEARSGTVWEGAAQKFTDTNALDGLRDRIVRELQQHFRVTLVRRRRALFEAADGRKRACVTISKRYDRDYQPYWYGYHVAWHEFLKQAEEGVLALGCMDRNESFVIPVNTIEAFLPKLSQTIRDGEGSSYWHVVITTDPQGDLAIYSSRTGDRLDLRPFSVALGPTSGASV
jgi:hypothetical protein